jgi:hypothetical protein
MKLYNLLLPKVGHISKDLFHDALYEAQRDIRTYKKIAPKWKFDNWSNRRKLIYIVNVMAVYIRLVCKFDLVKGDKGK